MNRPKRMVAGLIAAAIAAPVAADVIVDQPHDEVSGLLATTNVWDVDYRTGDDLRLFQDTTLTSMTFWMVLTWPNVPSMKFFLEVYEDSVEPGGDHEPAADPLLTIEGPEIVDRGAHPGYDWLRIFEVRYESLSISLEAGDYWLVPMVHGNGSNDDLGHWGTSGFGSINWRPGLHKGGFYQEWWPSENYLGYPSDFAMRVEGVVPGPGGVALGAIALLATVRPRRSRG